MTFPITPLVLTFLSIALFTASNFTPVPLAFGAAGIVTLAFAILAAADWVTARRNHNLQEEARGRIDPYTRLANSLRHLSPSTVNTIMKSVTIRVAARIGEFINGDRLPIFVCWNVQLQDGTELEIEFMLDYLRAVANWHREEPGVENSMWAVNWHTRAELPAELADYKGLEDRISRLTGAFVLWGLAEKNVGPYPAQLLYPIDEIINAFRVEGR